MPQGRRTLVEARFRVEGTWTPAKGAGAERRPLSDDSSFTEKREPGSPIPAEAWLKVMDQGVQGRPPGLRVRMEAYLSLTQILGPRHRVGKPENRWMTPGTSEARLP